jgi:hypothetical protein
MNSGVDSLKAINKRCPARRGVAAGPGQTDAIGMPQERTCDGISGLFSTQADVYIYNFLNARLAGMSIIFFRSGKMCYKMSGNMLKIGH